MNNPWYVTTEQVGLHRTEEELSLLEREGPRALASEVTPEQIGIYFVPKMDHPEDKGI